MRSFVAASLMALCATALSQPPTPSARKGVQEQHTSSHQDAQQSGGEQRGTEQAPIFVKSIPSTESDEDAAHKQYEHHEKPTLDRRITWATIILAIATCALFVFTAFLWKSTSRLVRDAKRSSELQLRAYVFVNKFAITQFEIGKPIEISFPVRNCGQTPAYSMVIRGWCGIRPYPYPADWRITTSGIPAASETHCAPGDDDKSGTGISENPLTDEMVARITVGDTERLYAYALVTYYDIFAEKIRTTEALACTGGPRFKRAIDKTVALQNGGQEATVTINWEYTKEQNRAD